MSAYSAPIEDITEFNSSLFNQPQVNLTQGEADLLYLSKTKNDTSTASLTTFNGQVTAANFSTSGSGSVNTRSVLSTFNAGSHEIYGAITGTLTIGGPNATNSIRGVTTFPQRVVIGNSFNFYPTLGSTNTVIGVTNSANLGATSAENVIIGSSNIGSGLTTGSNNVLIGRAGGTSGINAATSNSISIGRETNIRANNQIAIGLTASCNSTGSDNLAIGSYSTIVAGTGVNNIAIGLNATINTNISNSVAIGAGAVADTSNTIVLGRTSETVIIPNRIQFTPATYSFPFASSQQLGYYLKTTGTATGVTTATPTSIVTTASIPVGVWRIDFRVQNSVTAGGTITQAQSYISNTLNGNVGTAVAFTGSVVRSHVSEVYSTGDVQVITSSLTYQQSTAGVMYLNIVRSFSTGTYSFTGELSVTRIA